MGDGNKAKMLIAICAVIASVAALFIAREQGRVMRAAQHGAVFPVLQVDGYARNTDEFATLGIEVHNSGVGPAPIESVTHYMDGKDNNGFGDFAQTLPGNFELSWYGLTSRALAPGEVARPDDIKWPPNELDPETISRVTSNTDRWALEICYCSVFEKCWQTRELGRSRAEPAKSCEQGENDTFEDLGLEDLARQKAEALTAEASAEETPQ